MPAALALDLGSTGIKAGSLTDDGGLVVLGKRPAPPLSGAGLVRECDPEAYLRAATELLNLAQLTAPSAPIGIASQRSSFLIWEASSGQPVTALISWQDRRAAPWCDARAAKAADWARNTGLVLSPHYAGPKLATLFKADPSIRKGMVAGDLLFGTLETYLIWTWTGGRVHHTDLSMAARTLMVARGHGGWSRDLLKALGVPRTGLPHIGPSRGFSIPLGRGRIAATLADQAAGLLALTGDTDTALVNLGTGGFVMRAIGLKAKPAAGFLAGPLTGDMTEAGVVPSAIALEGTINGIGPALETLRGDAEAPDDDAFPNGFCLPDATGTGAPHWRPELGTIWSDGIPTDARYRIMLEGIVFRVTEIVSGMAPRNRPKRLVVAGGIANEPFIGPALAACTGIAVERLAEPEATLLGAATLAAGLPPGGAQTELVTDGGGAYLPDKYARWRRWLKGVLG